MANSVVIPQSASGIKSTADQTAGFIDEDQVLDTFDEFTFAIPIKAHAGSSSSSSSRPPTLKVTLVWTDPAGEQLQNDLDLIVVAPGGETERHGNQRAREFAFKTKEVRDAEEAATPKNGHAGEPYDRKNNVEQVVWEGIGKGEVGVVVRAHNVSSLKGQTFALAWKVY